MTDDLVKQFVEHLRFGGVGVQVRADSCAPLADAIQAITAEREALEQDNHRWKMECENFWRDREKALTAERDVAIKWWGESTELTRQARLQYSDEKARAEKAEAENARLREALECLLTLVEHANFEEGWCCCGDDMLHHQNPMDCGHTPVDMGEYHASLAIKEARAALKGETP